MERLWKHLNTEESAKALVRDYAARLYALAYRLCGNATTSEDLALRTIEQAAQTKGDFDSEKAFFAFLCTILVNLRRDGLRLKAANALTFPETLPETVDERPDPAETLARKNEAEAVRDAVERLSPTLRETVVLRYYGDLSVAETARTLGIPEGTVKFRLAEARRKIREILTQRFGVFPVTQTQWALIQSTRPYPSCFQYEADKKWRPVENICYNEVRLSNSETTGSATYYWPNDPHANSFLGRLRTKTGILFDMPSEAQWEFACRAGNGEGKWGDGSDYLSNTTDANLTALACYGRANIQNQVSEGNTTWTAADGGTWPVGTHAPNAWGFYDMHGNVFEMCLDWFEADPSAHGGAVNIDSSAPAKDLSGNNGTYRVCRGGSYRHGASSCRSAYRTELIANGRYNIYGVRVACPASAE